MIDAEQLTIIRTQMNKNQLLRTSALAGIVAPILYVGLVLILGLLEPGYNHLTDMMSVLGGVAGLRGMVFNTGLVVISVLVGLFTLGFHRNLNQGAGSQVGPGLLFLSSLGMLGLAYFSCSQNCANVAAQDLSGIVHIIIAGVTGLSLGMAPLFFLRRMKEDSRWQKYYQFTLLIAILANIAGALLWYAFFTTRLPAIDGLLQRLTIIFPCIWMFTMAYQLWQQSCPRSRD